jgi:hypothetical protein
VLRDPAKDWLAIDFELCLSDIVAECLLSWCSVVKEVTDRKRLTGAFSSYLMWQTGLVNALPTNGHLGLRRLLESPDIDFVTGITSYDNRGPGGPGSFMLPVESLQRAGKYLFGESDIRTHVLKDSSAIRWTSTGLLGLRPLMDAAESVDVLRREFCHHVIHGAGWWYFDMTGGWFDVPEIMAEFKKQAKIARDALAWDMTSVAEVACLVSGPGPAYHPLMRMHDVNNYPQLLELQCDRATRELYRSGLPLSLADDRRPGPQGHGPLQGPVLLQCHVAIGETARSGRGAEERRPGDDLRRILRPGHRPQAGRRGRLPAGGHEVQAGRPPGQRRAVAQDL